MNEKNKKAPKAPMLSKPIKTKVKPVTETPIALDDVLTVKNQKDKQFTVSKEYYLNNKDKLTLA